MGLGDKNKTEIKINFHYYNESISFHEQLLTQIKEKINKKINFNINILWTLTPCRIQWMRWDFI